MKLDDLKSDKNLYHVDEAYFDELSQTIQQRTTARTKMSFRQILAQKWMPYAVSSAFILVIVLFFGVNYDTQKVNYFTENQVFMEVSAESLGEYLMQEELDEDLLMEYYAENETNNFSAFSELSEEALETQFADEDLEDYF